MLQVAKVVLGHSATETNNFSVENPLNGTMKLARGGPGAATTQDILSVGTDGKVDIKQGMKVGGYESYPAKAWVNFNGSGTVAIRASANVSSITDNGTGNYTVNLTTAMPDDAYTKVASVSVVPGVGTTFPLLDTSPPTTIVAPTTSAFRLGAVNYAGTAYDPPYVYAAVFR